MVQPLELPELEMKPYGDSSSDMKNIKIPGMANFEEAMQLAGYGRFQLRAVTCSALCLLSVIVDGMSLGYLLPAAQCDLHMTFSQKGLLSSTGFIGFICSAHLWGAVGDMYGRRKTMMLALYLNSVCSSTSALAPTYATMLCLRFLSGFFSCGPAGLLYAYAGEFHDNVRRPRCVLMVSAISAVVSLLLPTLGWLVIPIPMRLPLPLGLPDLTSWRLFLALSGVFSFSSATALCLAMPESPKFLLENEQHGDALSVFRKVFAINTGRAESEYPVHALQSEKEESSGSDHGGKPQETRHSMLVKIWEQTAPLFGAKLRSTTALISILMCCSYIGFQPLIMWGPEMFNRLSSASTTVTLCEVMQHTSPVLNSTLVLLSEAADFVLESWEYNATSSNAACDSTVDSIVFFMSMLVNGAAGVTTIFAGVFVNLMGRRALLVSVFISSACITATLPFLNDPTLVQLLYTTGVSIACAAPSTIISAAIDLFPTKLRGMASSLGMLAGRVGIVIGTIAFGFLLELQCQLAFLLISASLAVGAILAFKIPSR